MDYPACRRDPAYSGIVVGVEAQIAYVMDRVPHRPPMKDLKGFDSPLGAVVTGLIAFKTCAIPLELDVFVDDNKCVLAIKESAALMFRMVKKHWACQ